MIEGGEIPLIAGNAEGKLVVHQAGQLVISPAGEILKVTPDVNPDNAAVICPVLGGQPAI